MISLSLSISSNEEIVKDGNFWLKYLLKLGIEILKEKLKEYYEIGKH